jgi:DNA polymerase III delta prime subunit
VRLKHALKQQTLPRDLLICGPAGTGKTYAVLMFLHRLARKHSHLRVLICRQTRASLTDSVLATLEQEVLPRHGGQGNWGHAQQDHKCEHACAR